MLYLLDTNILSEPIRKQPRPGILKKIKEHEADLTTATPVWHELLYGAGLLEKGRRRQFIESYLHGAVASLPILNYDRPAAEWHARERIRLQKTGKSPSFVDGQIAAIAAVNGLIVVSGNVRDFRRFNVKVENWI